jgi:Zn finger protein HypA/HybF involved in hydrogenase expression
MSPKGLEEDDQEQPAPVIVMRCEDCGDTYSTHVGATTICPSCGSTSANPAAEPLL